MKAGPTTALWHSRTRQLLVVAGLTGFAISQPLLSIIGEEPAVVAFHGLRGRELIAFAAVVALVPPLVLWVVPALVQKLNVVLGRSLHLTVVAVLASATLVQVAKSIVDPGVAGLLAVAGGVGFMIGYARHAAVTVWASYTAVLPLLAMGSFLMVSPTSELLSQPTEAPEAEGGDAPSVVMVVLDELPTRSLLDEAGSIDAVRYPNLAAFAGDATWYRHNTSQASFTESAIPSLLTGQVPDTEPPLFTSHPDNLFTLLAPTHELEVMEVATQLCPYEQCPPEGASEEALVTGPGFGGLLDVTRELWSQRVRPTETPASRLDDFAEEIASSEEEPPDSGPLVTVEPGDGNSGRGFIPTDDEMRATSVRADAMASSFDASKGSTLYFLHLLLPHQPWRYQADGALYNEPDATGYALPETDRHNLYSWSRWVATVSEQRHMLQMQYTDRVLGELLDQLDAAGLYDSSLVIVTADHGMSFEEDKPNRGVTESTIDALAYAPLLVKLPGQDQGAVDDSNVMGIDLVPTIAEVVDVDVPWAVDGSPVGSSAISARGTTKTIYDITGLGDAKIHDIIEYDDAEEFATVGDRWLGPLSNPDDPLSALTDELELQDVIGRPLDELVDGASGTATIDSLDQVRNPPDDRAPLAVISGTIDDPPDDGVALLALNGVVVAGSELSTDSDGRAGRLFFLIPLEVVKSSNDVRLAMLIDGEIIERRLN